MQLSRTRVVALLVVGAIAGSLFLTPAGAHVGGTVAHLWSKHIRPQVTKLVYTKAQSDARFVRRAGATRSVGTSGQPAFNAGTRGGIDPPGTACHWSNYDTSFYSAAGFFKDGDGVVHLQGLVDSDDGSFSCGEFEDDRRIFQLPAGYRPSKQKLFVVLAGSGATRLNVHPDGWVSGATAAAGLSFLSLDGVTFRTAT